MIDRTVFFRRRERTRTVTVNVFGGGVNREIDQGILPTRFSYESYNFNVNTDALTDGEGVRALTLPIAGDIPVSLPLGCHAKKCYFYKRYDKNTQKTDDRLLVYASNGKIYDAPLSGKNGFTAIPDVAFGSAPVGVNYRYGDEDVYLLCGKDGKLVVYAGSGTPTVVVDSPYVTSMTVHGERLFVTCVENPTLLRFSDDFDPTNWYVSLEEAGYVDFPDERGALLSVQSFLGYLYVFREYGITRLDAEGAQSGFSASQLFVSSGRIYGDTVAVCGDRVVFLASDGLYEFDGITARQTLSGIAPLFDRDNHDAVSGYAHGKYYLACRLKGEKGSVRAVLSYDVKNGNFYFMRGVDAIDFTVLKTSGVEELAIVLKDGTLAFRTDACTDLNGMGLEKIWRSACTDFNVYGERKRLEKLCFFSDGDVTVTVESETGKRQFSVRGKTGLITLKPNVQGSVFRLSFSSNALGARIVRPVMTFRVG